jgi:hypothetical protein
MDRSSGFPARCARPPVAATFSSRPIAPISTTRLLAPYEINGSGTPVSGISPSTAKKLRVAWHRISEVMPAASSF